MDYRDLKDSYSKLGETVEELASKGMILVVRNKDGNPRVLFHNEPDQNTHMDKSNLPEENRYDFCLCTHLVYRVQDNVGRYQDTWWNRPTKRTWKR